MAHSDILALFLVEALWIGIFGATVGLLAGIGLGYGLSATVVPGNGSSPPIYAANDMARVWMISVGLSIVAGVVPALQASRLLPAQALRLQ